MMLSVWIFVFFSLPVFTFGQILFNQSRPLSDWYWKSSLIDNSTGTILYDDFVVPEGCFWNISSVSFAGAIFANIDDYVLNWTDFYIYNWSLSIWNGPMIPNNVFYEYKGGLTDVLTNYSLDSYAYLNGRINITANLIPPGQYFLSIVALIQTNEEYTGPASISWYWGLRNTSLGMNFNQFVFVKPNDSYLYQSKNYIANDTGDLIFNIFGTSWKPDVEVLFNQFSPSKYFDFNHANLHSNSTIGNTSTEVYIQVADDFAVPVNGWTITAVSIYGSNSPYLPGQLGTISTSTYFNWTVEFYDRALAHSVYNYTGIPVTELGILNPYIEIPPLYLKEGTYWVSIFPTMTSSILYSYYYAMLTNHTEGYSFAIIDRTGNVYNVTKNTTWYYAGDRDVMFSLYGSNKTESPLTTQQQFMTTQIQPIDSSDLNNSNSDRNNRISIIAGVLGGFFILGVAILFVFLIRRHRTQTKHISKLIESSYQDDILSGITIEYSIGKGNFGEVYKGTFNGSSVAIKSIKDDSKFGNESLILKMLKPHPHVVKYFGIYIESAIRYIVMEYVEKGSLIDILKTEGKNFKPEDLLSLIVDTCKGMLHLEDSKIYHQDLAARNLLVFQNNSRWSVKISDFGMAQSWENSSNSSIIPTRWTAPEVILNKKYYKESDVWSFGVTCWEILTLGKFPYFEEQDNSIVISKVSTGTILSKPENCTSSLWDIISQCFTEQSKRPSFGKILHMLQEYNTINAKSLKESNEYELSVVISNEKHDYVMPELMTKEDTDYEMPEKALREGDYASEVKLDLYSIEEPVHKPDTDYSSFISSGMDN